MKYFLIAALILTAIGCSKSSDTNNPAPNPGGGSGGNNNPSTVVHGYYLDTSFKPTGANITLTAVQKDGKIIIANQTSIGRLNKDGSKDASFAVGSCAGGEIHCLALQSNGQILVGGSFLTFNGNPTKYLVRLNTDGSQDMTLTGNAIYDESLIPKEDVKTIAVQSNGRIIIGGSFSWQTAPQQSGVIPHQSNLIRLNADGSFDPSLWSYTDNYPPGSYYTEYNTMVNCVRVLADGKLLVCGQAFVTVDDNGAPYYIIAKLTDEGSVVRDFRFTANSFIMTNGLQAYPVVAEALPDGSILMGGRFNLIDNKAFYGLVHIGSKGA
ncbi:MAG: delta-60 repeat domain-containing protein, partial [Bacteroidetes bacterium]|nr:delta-60 repeat domain-containing protein [Bacteroidota bacterium]